MISLNSNCQEQGILSRFQGLVFLDLDGTFTNIYGSYEGGDKELISLVQAGLLPVFVTSKGMAPIQAIQKDCCFYAPYIFENGGGLAFPTQWLGQKSLHTAARWGLINEASGDFSHNLVISLADARENVIKTLMTIFEQRYSDLEFIFPDRPGRDVVSIEHLATLRHWFSGWEDRAIIENITSPRWFDVAFGLSKAFMQHHEDVVDQLMGDLERQGLYISKGGMFFHCTRGSDKRSAVEFCHQLFMKVSGRALTSVGIGDGHNDLDFLQYTDKSFFLSDFETKTTQAAQNNGCQVVARNGRQGFSMIVNSMI